MHERLLTSTALLVMLSGCAGNGAGLDANGDPLGSNSGSSGPLEANFDSIQAHVFTPICSVCHEGAGAPHGLRLDAADSYNLLVGIAADEVPSLLRVKPGDPDHSYIIEKLEGTAAVGGRMPLGGPYLSAADIATIRQWILDGAARSASSAAAPALLIEATAPATGDSLPDPPPQIMVGFNHALDRTRLDAHILGLQRLSDADAPAEIGARLEVRDENPQALLLWPARPLAAGRYRVVLRTSPGSLTDESGRALLLDGAALSPASGTSDVVLSQFDVMPAP